ncbi:hypothetical protein [Streptomyces sp. YKOK-I1]
MTGPEHYTRAEQLLREVRDGRQEGSDVANILAAAQVHATLAHAAATAMGSPVDGEGDSGLPPRDCKAWYDVAGVKLPPKGGTNR